MDVTTGTVPLHPSRPGTRHGRFVLGEDPAVLPAARGRPASLVRAFGPLAGLVADERVTDVFVNGGHGTWVDRGRGARPEPRVHLSEAAARDLAVRLVALGGRHVDEASPCVDVRLGRGVRVHAVLPPVSTSGTLLSVRLPRARSLDLAALADGGLFDDVGREGRDRVEGLVARRANLLVTGAGGAGKTTLLGALLGEADEGDRIVTVEDVAELVVRRPHVVSLEARQPNLEGAGGVDLTRLVREALRMRPDRLVVGECRGPEVRDLLAALNTGHDGGAGTLHANGPADVPARLEAVGAVAGLGPAAVARQVVSAIDAVLHVERTPEGRRLAHLGRLRLDGDRLEAVPL